MSHCGTKTRTIDKMEVKKPESKTNIMKGDGNEKHFVKSHKWNVHIPHNRTHAHE